ncbi:hypothetical protein C8R43DRAFT_1136866 [Mycena crocata]|nr:hypothetical protein C8R43DRAFT_1136866 [Mycena crocata]
MTTRKSRRRKPATQDEFVVSDSVAAFLAGPASAPITATVEKTSSDGRRTFAEKIHINPPTPVKEARRARQADAERAAPPPNPFKTTNSVDEDRYHMDFGGFYDDDPPPPIPTRRKNKFKPSDKTLYNWRPFRDEFLQEFIRLEGVGDANEQECPGCCIAKPTVRCQDCFGDVLYCASCCVQRHADNPLHFVDKWDGTSFSRTTLKALGLRVQLGHAGCARPHPAHEGFVVLDLPHVHEVAVDFCACERREPFHIQLLRRQWFPASQEIPKTAATFRCLRYFLILTHQAKTTMYDFYGALEKATDGAGRKPPNRYSAFLRMVREFRHLLMLKWAGRGHDPVGVNGTKPGGLAVRCPACPRPGVNLPEDWEKAPPEIKWLYTIFLALDACFRLKRLMISSELRDPGLGTGLAYFTEQEPFRRFLLDVTDQEEMSTCSGLAALDYANTKFSRGYSSTGVGMGVCARHEFVQPTGVADLQKGERYANMDWILASFLRWLDSRLFKVVSYDIVCQWFKKLAERLAALPPMMRLAIIIELYRFVIPKMHIHSHTIACQLEFSLNFLVNAGQTDGEGIERPWANIGAVATSTRQMGPGSRRDTLDSHWGFWNWCKVVGIAALLRRRLDKAKREREEHSKALETFTEEQGEERVAPWRAMVEAWEKDPQKNKNPFEGTVRKISEAEVRLKFSQEEAEREQRGVPPLHDVSPSTFIYAGLELEDQQRRVAIQVELKKAQTTAQKIDVLGLRRKLSRGIVRFRKLQATYTPGALQALARRPANPKEVPETTPLMLPSAMTAQEREVGCMAGVDVIEGIARDAQCDSALVRLRNQLHIKSRLMTHKKSHARHQKANTRSRTTVARNESKISQHSGKYQAAWTAMCSLAGDASKVGWRKLRKEDIRMMQDPEELSRREVKRRKRAERERATRAQLIAEGEHLEALEADDDAEWVDEDGDEGEAVRTKLAPSWIWMVTGTTGSDAELEEALRIEWAKAFARSRRWTEEVLLLEEEWRRVFASFDYEAKKWDARARDVKKRSPTLAPAFVQGAVAYATRQAAMWRDLAQRAYITKTEIHRGRGRKRIRLDSSAGPVGAERTDDGWETDNEDDDDGEDDDDEGESGDEEDRDDVHSDEEHFLGGDEDVD